MKTRKILHLLSQRPDSTGSGIYVQAMVREAAAGGYENCLVAGLGPDTCEGASCISPDRFFPVGFGRGDIAYALPGMSDIMPYESSRFCDLSPAALEAYEAAFADRLRSAVGRFSPDIIHSHHLWIVSALARRLFPEMPLVTTCHGTDLRQFQNCPHLQERVRADCGRLDGIMALSREQKEDIARLYRIAPEKITVVGAGYNHHLFYRARKPLPEPVQLLYAGKLCLAKGLPWLLRALEHFCAEGKTCPAWQLHLVGGGSGAEKELCLELAGKLGDRVRVYGALEQTELARIMRQAHILVLPSFFEGLPLVLLEALASGCRLVVTALPGTRELFDQLETDLIARIPMPRLQGIDRPCPEAEAGFEQHLGRALVRQMRAVADDGPDNESRAWAPVQKLLDTYTWAGIFGKVAAVYRSALETPRKRFPPV